MAETEMNHQEGNLRRFTITADAGQTAIEIELPEEANLPVGRQHSHYKIVKKDIPQKATGKRYGNQEVIWINNYGIRLRGNFAVKAGGNKDDPFIDEVQGQQFRYEVIVPGPSPKDHPTLVYFDGENVQPANPTIETVGQRQYYHFFLNIGDPADGWGG